MTMLDTDLISATGSNGPGVRPKKGFDIGTDHTMTRREYELRHRNVVAPTPIGGTVPVASGDCPRTMSVDELLSRVRSTGGNVPQVQAALRQLTDAGFDETTAVRLMLGDLAKVERRDSIEARLIEFLEDRGGEYRSADGRCLFELGELLGAGMSSMTKIVVKLAKAGRLTRDVTNAGTTRVALP